MRSCVCHFFVVTLQPKVAKLMSKTLKDRLDYLIALVSEFAATHHLSLQQAYLYLQQYKGLDFADEFYDVEHTLSFDQAVEDITMYCKLNINKICVPIFGTFFIGLA